MSEPFEVGEEIYIVFSGYGRTTRKARVTRVTKTQAIVQDGRSEGRYNRETGWEVGGGTWSSSRIERPTPALDRIYARERADDARRALALVASQGTADEIRAAYAKWERLEQGVSS